MPTQLYGGLPEDKFRTMAKSAVRDYWNSTSKLVKKFGEITNRQIFVVWQVKAIQNNKALLGVNVDGDGMFTIADVTTLINAYLDESAMLPRYDVNGDGQFNIKDITDLIDWYLSIGI